jgi:hypothetical protein
MPPLPWLGLFILPFAWDFAACGFFNETLQSSGEYSEISWASPGRQLSLPRGLDKNKSYLTGACLLVPKACFKLIAGIHSPILLPRTTE